MCHEIEEKGVLLLAEAANRAQMPVRFVGEGPMAAEIARIHPEVELAGWVPAGKVSDEIAQARVLVAPSLWYETGPMTVLEAAALGVPAIVSNHMGAADWVQNGITGRHVAQGDATALESALREAKSAAAAWGDNSYRVYWDKPFTLEQHTERLMAAYGMA
jgi:glycosyltransferase involved in cell wall biosynthesis